MKKYYVYFATIGHMINDSSQSVIPALLPFFIATYGLTYEQAGALIFANTALSSVLQPILGYASDKFNYPRLIGLGITLSGCSIAAMGFVHSYPAIFACAMIAGIGSAIFHPEGAKLVNRLGGLHKGKSMGTFAVGGSAGFALGPVIAAFCAYYVGIHGLLVIGIGAITISTVLFILMPTITAYSKEVEATTAKQLNNLAEAKNDWKSFLKLFVILFARSINFSVINAFIPIYWVTILHQSPERGSLALTILFVIGIIVTYVGGLLADRFGYVKIIRLSLLIWMPATLAITNVETPWLGWLLLLPLGFARAVIYSPITILGQTYLAKSIGFASGVTLGLSITMGGLFAPIVGNLADNYGLQNAMQLLNVTTTIALIMSFFITNYNRKMYPQGPLPVTESK